MSGSVFRCEPDLRSCVALGRDDKPLDSYVLSAVPAILSVFVAAIALRIAWRQHQTAILANRMAAFQRRLKIFQTVEEHLQGFSVDFNLGDGEREQRRKLLDAMDEARFLFGDDVNGFLERLYWDEGKLQSRIGSAGGARHLSSEVMSEMTQWWDSHKKDAEKLFRPYLEYKEK